MFTASDMENKLKQSQVCHGIDAWIENDLFNKFESRSKSSAYINVSVIGNMGWKREAFTNEMNLRGFIVDFTTDQRDGDFYTISFPPQTR